jgi:hypothetical protein
MKYFFICIQLYLTILKFVKIDVRTSNLNYIFHMHSYAFNYILQYSIITFNYIFHVLFILKLYKPSNRYDHYLATHTHHVIYCHLNNFPLNHTTFPLVLSLYISCTTLVLQVTTFYSLFFYYSVF